MALDANHGPVIGSCTNCMGVVTVNGGSVTYNAEYYVLGHLSKFVPPGAVRIASTAQGQGGIENVAFRNPDGTIVLVAVNSGGAQNFQVSYGGPSFGYNLPGRLDGDVHLARRHGGDQPRRPPRRPTPPPATRTGPDRRLRRQVRRRGRRQPANGTAVQLYACNGSAAQQWTVGADSTHPRAGQVPGRDGTWAPRTAPGSRSGTVRAAPTRAGRPPTGTLVAANSGRCLDATNVSSADGTPLQIWDCTGGANQRWTLPA